MKELTFRTSIDCAQRLVATLNHTHRQEWFGPRHAADMISPMLGDYVLVHEDKKCKIIMKVVSRVWHGKVLHVELGLAHYPTVIDMQRHMDENGVM